MLTRVIFAATTAFLVIISASLTEAACDVTMENMGTHFLQSAMECVAHAPELLSEDSNVVCSKLPEAVKFVLCMKEKYVDCVQDQNDREFFDKTFSYGRIKDMASFVCKNRTVLMNNDKCLDLSVAQHFIICYFGKIQNFITVIKSGSMDFNIEDIFCQVIDMLQDCFKRFHGSCDQESVNLVVQTLEKFFPANGCPKKDFQDLAHYFVHGQPLKFKPKE